MINNLIKSIGIALYNEFGDNYKIYPEKVEQGLKEPCFFISCLNPTMELFLGRRYFRTFQFCVQYIPAKRGKEKAEGGEVTERLYRCLEWITAIEDGLPIRGTQMRAEFFNGILNFFINYDCFVTKPSDKVPMMEELTYKLKG